MLGEQDCCLLNDPSASVWIRHVSVPILFPLFFVYIIVILIIVKTIGRFMPGAPPEPAHRRKSWVDSVHWKSVDSFPIPRCLPGNVKQWRYYARQDIQSCDAMCQLSAQSFMDGVLRVLRRWAQLPMFRGGRCGAAATCFKNFPSLGWSDALVIQEFNGPNSIEILPTNTFFARGELGNLTRRHSPQDTTVALEIKGRERRTPFF